MKILLQYSLSAFFGSHDSFGLDKLTGQAPGVMVSSTGGLYQIYWKKGKEKTHRVEVGLRLIIKTG